MAGTMALRRTDADIRQDVLDELDWDSHLLGGEIGVAVKEGVVALTGSVDSYLNRHTAEEAAHRVLGVRAVANDIEVHVPSSAERTDADLARAVLSALQWDAAIPAGTLDVTVSKGRVTLTGQVEWRFQREAAERVVQRLAGVTGVNNHLMVKLHPVPADVRQRIERALIRNAEVDARHINVAIKGAVAVLTGTVRSYSEKRAAERSALAAPGVTAVESYIQIEPEL